MSSEVDWLQMKVDHLKSENAKLSERVKALEAKVKQLEYVLFGDGGQKGAIHD